MRPTAPRSRAAERGFALIGVVLFTLVLTILGLSLFALSGFEAQFFGASLERAQSFHAAAGGLERARFALVRTGRLESVRADLPRDGVVYAVARQGPDSIGEVDWKGGPISIRVLARKGRQSRLLEAGFQPARGASVYGGLASLSDPAAGLAVARAAPGDPTDLRWPQTYLDGRLWQNHANDPDRIFPAGSCPTAPCPSLPLRLGGVPAPDIDSYLARRLPGAIPSQGLTPGFQCLFDATEDMDQVAFFKTTHAGTGGWSQDITSGAPRIVVRGTAVWLLDRGLRSERTIIVSGSGNPNDMLVVVARAQTTDPTDPGTGVALLGSLHSPTVPVILVSDGRVTLESRFEADHSTTIGCLAIFASQARVLGPRAPARMTLSYGGEPAEALLDKLLELGVLPNTQPGLAGKLEFLAGTWREVMESDPD